LFYNADSFLHRYFNGKYIRDGFGVKLKAYEDSTEEEVEVENISSATEEVLLRRFFRTLGKEVGI